MSLRFIGVLDEGVCERFGHFTSVERWKVCVAASDMISRHKCFTCHKWTVFQHASKSMDARRKIWTAERQLETLFDHTCGRLPVSRSQSDFLTKKNTPLQRSGGLHVLSCPNSGNSSTPDLTQHASKIFSEHACTSFFPALKRTTSPALCCKVRLAISTQHWCLWKSETTNKCWILPGFYVTIFWPQHHPGC